METTKEARYKFDEQGTLTKPGPIGRVVRFSLGVLSLYVVYILLDGVDYLTGSSIPGPGSWWIGLVFGVLLFPDVFNIGFGIRIGRRPLYAIIASLAVLLGAVGFINGNFWSPLLAWFVEVWLLYIYSHLGLSLVLASIIATPGCEMRAIPQLWTMLTGRTTADHYCPGFIGRVDRWEEKLMSKGNSEN